jgi:sortase B
MRKETPMKNKIYMLLSVLSALYFAVSSGFLIKRYYDSAKQAEMYDNLIEVGRPSLKKPRADELFRGKDFYTEYQELYLQNNDWSAD